MLLRQIAPTSSDSMDVLQSCLRYFDKAHSCSYPARTAVPFKSSELTLLLLPASLSTADPSQHLDYSVEVAYSVEVVYSAVAVCSYS